MPPRPLKAYRMLLRGTHVAVCAAPTVLAATAAVDSKPARMRGWVRITADEGEVETAMAKPGTAFVRDEVMRTPWLTFADWMERRRIDKLHTLGKKP